jgi:hypothetical protein
MVDKVERTVSEYAWLCIKRAHVQRPLFGMWVSRMPGEDFQFSSAMLGW